MLDYISAIASLTNTQVSYCVVTLVDKRGSVPQEIGAKMVVTPDSKTSPFFGTIGGGRVELTAINTAIDLLTTKGESYLKKINLDNDLGMVCGGEVTLFFEVNKKSSWHISIFGAGHVCQALVSILINLDCNITVFDEREEWLNRLPRSLKLKTVKINNLSEDVNLIPDNSFVLSLSHGHVYDQKYLTELLKTRRFPYVGAIGSNKKSRELKSSLLESGIDENVVSQIRSPIGMKLGNNQPYEVAVSIVAELIETRDQR